MPIYYLLGVCGQQVGDAMSIGASFLQHAGLDSIYSRGSNSLNCWLAIGLTLFPLGGLKSLLLVRNKLTMRKTFVLLWHE